MVVVCENRGGFVGDDGTLKVDSGEHVNRV
jgi:hypothetical protein